MLTAKDVCIIESVAKGAQRVIVQQGQFSYGLGSGKEYLPGEHKPDSADKGGWIWPHKVHTTGHLTSARGFLSTTPGLGALRIASDCAGQ